LIGEGGKVESAHKNSIVEKKGIALTPEIVTQFILKKKRIKGWCASQGGIWTEMARPGTTVQRFRPGMTTAEKKLGRAPWKKIPLGTRKYLSLSR